MSCIKTLQYVFQRLHTRMLAFDSNSNALTTKKIMLFQRHLRQMQLLVTTSQDKTKFAIDEFDKMMKRHQEIVIASQDKRAIKERWLNLYSKHLLAFATMTDRISQAEKVSEKQNTKIEKKQENLNNKNEKRAKRDKKKTSRDNRNV